MLELAPAGFEDPSRNIRGAIDFDRGFTLVSLQPLLVNFSRELLGTSVAQRSEQMKSFVRPLLLLVGFLILATGTHAQKPVPVRLRARTFVPAANVHTAVPEISQQRATAAEALRAIARTCSSSLAVR